MGVVLDTAFEFAATNWIDDAEDLPLLYSFYYSIFGDATNTEYQLVANTPATSYSGALLPRGGGNASEITALAYVADQLGATASATATIVCAPLVVSVSELANKTSKLLADSFESGNIEGVYQVMVASSSILNAVNCSTLASCGTLLRDECDTTDNVCGDCADGYAGLDGPSNKACFAPASTCGDGLLNGGESDYDCGGDRCGPCAEGAACGDGADCEYGLCLNGACAAPVMPCASNCSNHGACEHMHVSGRSLASAGCRAGMTSCYAVCACDANWYGDDCAWDEAAYSEVTSLRDSMIDSLASAVDKQDVETSTMNQQASSLSSLARESSELSSAGALVVLDLASSLAEGSSELGLAGGTSDAVGDTISNLLDTGLLAGNMSVPADAVPSAAPTRAAATATATALPTISRAPSAAPRPAPSAAPTRSPLPNAAPTLATSTPAPTAVPSYVPTAMTSAIGRRARRLLGLKLGIGLGIEFDPRGPEDGAVGEGWSDVSDASDDDLAPSSATPAPTTTRVELSEAYWRRYRRRLEEATNAETALGSVTSALSSLTSAHLVSAVAGEASTTVTTSNIKMASQRHFAGSVGAENLAPPLTEDEKAAGKVAPRLYKDDMSRKDLLS